MSQKTSASIDQLNDRVQPNREITGIAATLLPFNEDGTIAVDAFQEHVRRTHDAGLLNAVNMDTGYANYLTDDQKEQVLKWTRNAIGDGESFVAGVYIEEDDGDPVSCYKNRIEDVLEYGATPILFQTSDFHDMTPSEKVSVYRDACEGYPDIIGFELGKMFADFGEIFEEDTIKGLMDIPEMIGLKHSSLDRMIGFRRLELRDEHDPDFRIFTGNDLAIDMIEYGADYLLGLATFAPEKFGERDQFWAEGNPAYYQLSDALQFLGNVAFREPTPAYRHSAAEFLHLTGRIPSSEPHADCPRRPSWEPEILKHCANRLDLSIVVE